MIPINDTLEAAVARMNATAAKCRAEFEAVIASAPPEIHCARHATETRHLDFERSERAFKAVYEPCPQCSAEAAEAATRERLAKAGAPGNLLSATVESWIAPPGHEGTPAILREFLRLRAGFLVLLGTVGTGKTHIAVAIMRHFKRPVFFKQSALLRALRETYRNRAALDPIEICQSADLFCLDDFGLSVGGRDEAPLLFDILDFRYTERLPSVITTNLSWLDFKATIGERLADRITESAFRIIEFGHASHRRAARHGYFDAAEANHADYRATTTERATTEF